MVKINTELVRGGIKGDSKGNTMGGGRGRVRTSRENHSTNVQIYRIWNKMDTNIHMREIYNTKIPIFYTRIKKKHI